ncbi:uncharacterized protein [Haliaeetus albicilla]|uniref:uncharacterized protein isoform X1 n=1 Tax=Haliaeetus albicilla TaxID=8969 RepID=UPI0037E8D6B8
MSWRPAAARHQDRATMRGAVIFLAFTGAVTTISIAPLQNPVWVSPGEKAILPVSLQLLNPTWDFYHIKWSFLTGDRPVLIYTMERCNQTLAASGQQCQQRMEVGDFYNSRANISYNTSLVLQDTRPDDAGVYQLTVQGLDVAHTMQVTLILQGTFSPLFLSGNPAHAHLNQTALLSFSLRTPCSGWDFIHITWELISSPKNHPILTYTLDGCTGKAWNWWEQSCTISQEVDGSYRQRAGVRPNGTLALRDVRDEDAGTYLVTVRAPDGLACVGVNLSVSREMLAVEWPSILSIIQIAAAGVVLCFLALILGEVGDKTPKLGPTSLVFPTKPKRLEAINLPASRFYFPSNPRRGKREGKRADPAKLIWGSAYRRGNTDQHPQHAFEAAGVCPAKTGDAIKLGLQVGLQRRGRCPPYPR